MKVIIDVHLKILQLSRVFPQSFQNKGLSSTEKKTIWEEEVIISIVYWAQTLPNYNL